MKKVVVISLLSVFALGIAGSAFAQATSPTVIPTFTFFRIEMGTGTLINGKSCLVRWARQLIRTACKMHFDAALTGGYTSATVFATIRQLPAAMVAKFS